MESLPIFPETLIPRLNDCVSRSYDLPYYPRGVALNFVICKAHYQPTLIMEESVLPLIFGAAFLVGVVPTIDLDRQFSRLNVKIKKIRSGWHLNVELNLHPCERCSENPL